MASCSDSGRRLGAGRRGWLSHAGLATGLLASAHAWGLEQAAVALSLEELANAQVTSAAKKTQPLSETSAAVYVISREAIRQSGATSIPEALRLAPGLSVSRINAQQWAVGIRGFHARFSNKLLVLVDGRAVYDHSFFSGVYWENLALPLEEIERIEVIRGPGGTLWGANAVNGIINIITRRATDTLGSQVSAGAGSNGDAYAGARYGTSLGENAYARLYAKTRRRQHSEFASGADAEDAWRLKTGGFRIDWQQGTADELVLQGDSYDAHQDKISNELRLGPPFRTPRQDTVHGHGSDLLARWTHGTEDGGELSVQAYYDDVHRAELVFGTRAHIWDLDVQHRFPLTPQQELVWGFGYRSIKSEVSGEFVRTLEGDTPYAVKNVFRADEFGFLKDRLKLSLGVKWEDHERVGSELQPSLRFNWDLGGGLSTWGAYSRAVRTPSRTELDTEFLAAAAPSGRPSPAVLATFLIGDPALDTEKLAAQELGLRWLASDSLSLDLALFRNRYDDLVFFVFRPLRIDSERNLMRLDAVPANRGEATARGAELALQWLPTDWWTLSLSYSQIELESPGASDALLNSQARGLELGTPERLISAHNHFNLAPAWSLDLWLLHRDGLGSATTRLDARTDVELQLGWQLSDQFRLNLSGKNLSDNDDADFVGGTRVPRSAYLALRYDF